MPSNAPVRSEKKRPGHEQNGMVARLSNPSPGTNGPGLVRRPDLAGRIGYSRHNRSGVFGGGKMTILTEPLGATNADLDRLDITKDLYLRWDKEDTWFALEDADWFSYDRGGAVIMNFSDIDALIVALGQLRDKRFVPLGGKVK